MKQGNESFKEPLKETYRRISRRDIWSRWNTLTRRHKRTGVLITFYGIWGYKATKRRGNRKRVLSILLSYLNQENMISNLCVKESFRRKQIKRDARAPPKYDSWSTSSSSSYSAKQRKNSSLIYNFLYFYKKY